MQSTSVPLVSRPIENEYFLEGQYSAPSHLVSLAHNEAPPFRPADAQMKPKVLVWTFISEKQTKELMEVARLGNNELARKLENLLVNKYMVASCDISEKRFLSSLLVEAFCYGKLLRFNAIKISTLLTIYINSHRFFKSYYWLAPSALWAYFKNLMLCHSIDDSPDGQEIFEPEESCDIASHFHSVYLCNMPLIHIRTFGAHRLKLSWPFQA